MLILVIFMLHRAILRAPGIEMLLSSFFKKNTFPVPNLVIFMLDLVILLAPGCQILLFQF